MLQNIGLGKDFRSHPQKHRKQKQKDTSKISFNHRAP